MREFSKISPKFWIGPTGKKIRAMGPQAQVVALYLLSSPHSNMLGIYHLPIAYIAADTGSPFEGASKALQSLSEGGFCAYDLDTEMVFVYEMAKYQIGEKLSESDNLVKSIRKELKTLPKSILLNRFYDKYKEAYHLGDISPFEGPSKPLRSIEIEIEIEREREKEKEITDSADTFCIGVDDPQSRTKKGVMRETKKIRSAPSPKVNVSFDYQTGNFANVPQASLDKWAKAYPSIDVQRELAKAGAWMLSNTSPGQRKKHATFLNNWMGKAYEIANRPARAAQVKPAKYDPHDYFDRLYKRGKYADSNVIDITEFSNAAGMDGKRQ